MSDFYIYFFTILVLLLIIVVPVQWVLNVHFGFMGGIISCIGLSFLGALGAQAFYEWGKGVGSVTGFVRISQAELLSIFGFAFIISLVLTALTNIGVYQLVQFKITGILNKPVFYSWLVITVGGPIMYMGVKELNTFLALREQRFNFICVQLEIHHHHELPVSVDQLEFMNTRNQRKMVVQPPSGCKLSFGEEEQDNEGDRFSDPYHVVFDERISIPVGTDKFIMSWYSFVEDKYYSDEFPFDYEKFAQRKWPDGSGIMGGFDFYIKPDGKVDVLGNYHKHLTYYFDVGTKSITQEEKDKKLQAFSAWSLPKGSKNKITEMLGELRASGTAQKWMTMQEKTFNWFLSVKGPGKIFNIRMHDFRHQQYYTTYQWLNTLIKKLLPAEITMYIKKAGKDNSVWIDFYADKEKLFHHVEKLTSGNGEMPVEFSLTIKDSEAEEVEFLIKTPEKTEIFDNYRLKFQH